MILVSGLPDPPEGRQWCAACAAIVLHQYFNDEKVKVRYAAVTDEKAASQTEVVSVAPPKGWHMPVLHPAVTMAPSEHMGMAVVPVCWSHAPALGPVEEIPDDGRMPPGFGGRQRLIPGLS